MIEITLLNRGSKH